tara:strand:- start:991 stop:1437 length:447 start_codon:yes stop_codon:yes gene_type:complete
MIVEPNKNKVIHESYKDLMARHRKNEMAKQKAAIAKLAKLTPAYIKQGYTLIHVYYSGCGDSGEVTEVYAHTDNKDTPGETHSFNYNDIVYIEISNIVYDLLTYDWYNDNGGGGNVVIDLVNKEIAVDGHYIVEQQITADDQQANFKF